ncbi:hypothetical protein H5410_037276 [Solanum commersonii]|uniref:Putative plant transposon protein domain-containing protein n=1 Tax=Solanum commersonii TaxID=4109 RepID=A0A9J5Y9R4_SOLCO|nr:hypothetical protein H5410_037276 [Solanum commersonii]
MRRIQELQMKFIFNEPIECNLHMIREFYANWATEFRSHFVKVQGVDVTLTPAILNNIVGIPPDADSLVLTWLNIRPPYRAIRHTLYGPQSMVQWTKHNAKRFHQSLPYAYMIREARVWLKIMMNYLIPRLHYTDITRDRVCLVYALMTPSELNIDIVLKSCIRGELGLYGTTFPKAVDITKTKGPDNEFGPTLTTVERYYRDELIMARIYGLEILRHQNGCQASTDVQLRELERRYPLNAHAKATLGIGPEFHKLVDDDIPTDEDRLHTSSNVDSDFDTEEVDPSQAGDEADGGDTMED